MIKYDKIAVSYSGGYDSLVAAIETAAVTKEVHLVTYRTYSTVLVKNSKRNVENLRKKFPDVKFIHTIIGVKKIHRKMLTDFVDACIDYRKKGVDSKGMWCCACHMGMRTALLIYCLENNIPACVDGAIRSQSFFSSSNPKVINKIKKLYAEYGIKFLNPIYDLEIDKREFLKEKGYTVGYDVFGVSKTIQPFCFFGLGPIVKLGHPVSGEGLAGFIEQKIPGSKAIVDNYLKEKSIEKSTLKKVPFGEEEFLSEQLMKNNTLGFSKKAIFIAKMISYPFYILFGLIINFLHLKNNLFSKKGNKIQQ